MNGKSKSPLRFQGFSPELFGFLSRLAINNSKEWFNDHRHIYESFVVGPIKAFTYEAGEVLRLLNPGFDTQPRIGKTVSRITNDVRFHKERPPYRTFLNITYTDSEANRSTSPAIYVGVTRHGISVGFHPGGQREPCVGPVQRAILSNQRLFQKYLTERRIAQRYWELASNPDGEVTKWPLPRTARRWAAIDNFIIGEHFNWTDPIVMDRLFLDRVSEIVLDLYPIWIFCESEQLKEDLDLCARKSRILSLPVTKAAD